MPVITVSGKIADPEEVVAACPKKVFEISGDTVKVKDGKLYDCILCETCSEMEQNIKVESKDTEFVFTFETDGSLTAQQVLDEAVRILSENAKDLGEKIAALASE